MAITSMVIDILCAGAYPDGGDFTQNNQSLASPFNFSYLTTIGVGCQISIDSLVDNTLGTLTPSVPASPTTFTLTNGVLSLPSAQIYTDSGNTTYRVTPTLAGSVVTLSLRPISQSTFNKYNVRSTLCNLTSGNPATPTANTVLLNQNTNTLSMTLTNLTISNASSRPNWCLITSVGAIDYTNLSSFLTSNTSVCGTSTITNTAPYNANANNVDCNTYFGRAYATSYYLSNGSLSGLTTANCTTGGNKVDSTTLTGSYTCPDTPTTATFRTSSTGSITFSKTWSAAMKANPTIMIIGNNCNTTNRPSICRYTI